MKHLAIVLTAVGFTGTGTQADKPAAKKPKTKPFQAVCPVMGRPAIKDSFITFKGKKLYFCCPGCPDQFDKTDKNMVTQAHLQLFATGQIVQIACPLKGHDLDSEVTMTIAKQKVKFCCPGCVKGLKKQPKDKQIAAVFAKIDTTFTGQTKCPVTGRPIDPDERYRYKKAMVYFHNSKARKAFIASPKKYEAKLPQTKSAKK